MTLSSSSRRTRLYRALQTAALISTACAHSSLRRKVENKAAPYSTPYDEVLQVHNHRELQINNGIDVTFRFGFEALSTEESSQALGQIQTELRDALANFTSAENAPFVVDGLALREIGICVIADGYRQCARAGGTITGRIIPSADDALVESATLSYVHEFMQQFNRRNSGSILTGFFNPVTVSCSILLGLQGVRGTMNAAAMRTLEQGMASILGPIGEEARPKLENLVSNVVVDARPVTYRQTRNLRELQTSLYNTNQALVLNRAICKSDDCSDKGFEDFVFGEMEDLAEPLSSYLRLNGPTQGTDYFNGLRAVTVNGTSLVSFYPKSEEELDLHDPDPRNARRQVPWWLWAALAVDAGLLVFIVWTAVTLRLSWIEKERVRLTRREEILRAKKHADILSLEQKQALIDEKMRAGLKKGGMDVIETSRKPVKKKRSKGSSDKDRKKQELREMVKETKELEKKKRKSKKKSKSTATSEEEYGLVDEQSLSTVGDRLAI